MSSFPPPIIYPNTATAQPASHHSRGSFGPVFAVLAVVVVLSAIACIIGQICARRFSHSKHQQNKESHHHPKHQQNKDHHHPKHQQNKDSHHQLKHPMMDSNLHDDEEGDIEFGFKPRMQKEKPAGYRETRAPKFAEYGKSKGEKIFAEQSKASAF